MIALYYAVGIDGFIADEHGGVGWLDRFNDTDYGYESFITETDSIIFGRRTYEQQLSFGAWPFAAQRCFVLTQKALSDANVEAVCDVDVLARRLRDEGLERTWIIGGGQTMGTFLDRGLVDRIDHFVIPVLLGRGVPLFPQLSGSGAWRLNSSRAFPNGVVHLRYEADR